MTDEIRTNAVFIGRYQVQRELGRGGMGAVYLAFDLQFRKPVAIKVARLAGPEARAQFRREALYLQRLHHHNLPQVLDVFSDTQRDFLVMEYIPGDDLETLVQQQGPQPEWLVLRWADELLDVLDYLHIQTPPIIHRDVKPGNLKLRQNDTLVLVDFGIAKESIPEGGDFVGATAVTPGFSPPEQYSDGLSDARTDVYSAGATLYYLLTGAIPAAAPDRASGAAVLAPLTKLAPKTSQVTGALVHKALNLAGEERWANAAEMRRAAVVAARKLASAAPPPPATEPPNFPTAAGGVGTAPRPGQRSLGLAGVAALLGVALLAVAALLWTLGGSQPSVAPRSEPSTFVATTAATQPMAVQATASPTVVEVAPSATAISSSAGETASTAATDQPVTAVDTSTPIPTRTPMSSTGTATLTALSQATSAPTRPSGAAAGSGTPSPAATAPSTATPASVPAVKLLEPAAGAVGSGERLFRWQADHGLSDNEAFELVFWRPGQEAMRDAFGPVGVTQEGSGGMRINLDEADVLLGALLDPGDYLWGVLLVETNPYRRILLLSEARAFRFERSGGGDGGSGEGDPGPTRPAPPPGPTRSASTASPPAPGTPQADR